MQLQSIHAAILAQNGNHDTDEHYPEPLTCHRCLFRPMKLIGQGVVYQVTEREQPFPEDRNVYVNYWYVTTTDPLPAGWVARKNEEYGFTTTLCPPCVAKEQD